jgi:hypothetical protein
MLPRALALAVAIAAAPASAAPAAALRTDARCYQETQAVVLTGTGYAPLATVIVSRDGRPLGTARTDADGAFRRRFVTPRLPSRREVVYRLSATDGNATARVRYRATKVFAGYRPTSGDPRRLRVRFFVSGFALARPRAPVYLHYVRRSTNRVRRTVRLGTALGSCGVIGGTRPRRLFPFRPARGTWILQFDTARRYERPTGRRSTPWVRRPVEVFARRR